MITLSDGQRAKLHRAAIARFDAAVATAPDAMVPFYPGWTVRDLAVHVVAVHTMACVALETAATERPSFEVSGDREDDPATLSAALHTLVERLDGALAETALMSVWAVLPDRHPRAWRRRMLLEATLHSFDAEAAAGDPAPVPTEVARDGIDEFLHLHARKGLIAAGLDGGVELHDDIGSWHLDLASTEIQRTTAHDTADGGPQAGAVVSGSPAALWLWLNRREPLPDDVEVADHDGTGGRFASFLDGLSGPAS